MLLLFILFLNVSFYQNTIPREWEVTLDSLEYEVVIIQMFRY